MMQRYTTILNVVLWICKVDAEELKYWEQQVKKYINRQDDSQEIQSEINNLNVEIEKMRANHAVEKDKIEKEINRLDEDLLFLNRGMNFSRITLDKLRAENEAKRVINTNLAAEIEELKGRKRRIKSDTIIITLKSDTCKARLNCILNS